MSAPLQRAAGQGVGNPAFVAEATIVLLLVLLGVGRTNLAIILTLKSMPTRAHPESLLLIFRWPRVLAWLHNTMVGKVLAMLKSVPF